MCLQLEREQEHQEECSHSAPEFIKVKENLRRTSLMSTSEKEVQRGELDWFFSFSLRILNMKDGQKARRQGHEITSLLLSAKCITTLRFHHRKVENALILCHFTEAVRRSLSADSFECVLYMIVRKRTRAFAKAHEGWSGPHDCYCITINMKKNVMRVSLPASDVCQCCITYKSMMSEILLLQGFTQTLKCLDVEEKF